MEYTKGVIGMKIAILSGKGGAGKTFTAVNLASVMERAVYVDCDVEEPNGRLFLKPDDVKTHEVYTLLPNFDASKCTGCKKCVDFCKFNALVYVKDKPIVFKEICHSCGGCELVCPEGAVSEEKRPVGIVEVGTHNNVKSVTGVLNFGEASGVPAINEAIKTGDSIGDTVILDCPPGSACSVMESVEGADYCILVAEPTAFGFHNFKMVYELVTLLGKPLGVVINKEDEAYKSLEDFCKSNNIPILMHIPYDKEIASLSGEGHIYAEESDKGKELFTSLLSRIGGAC